MTENGAQNGPVPVWATPLIDVLTVLAYLYLLPALTARFAQAQPVNGLIVLLAFFLLVAGTWLTRVAGATGALAKQPGEDTLPLGGWGVFFAVCYSVFAATIAVTSSGAIAEGGPLSEAGTGGLVNTLAWALATLAYLAMLVAYPVVVAVQLKPRSMAPLRTFTLRLLGVSGVNVMMLAGIAYWNAEMSDAEPMGLAIGGRILVFVLTYTVLLMFFAPPRLILAGLERSNWGLATFLLSLACYVWPLTR